MKFSWKRWKLGFGIAMLIGIFQACVAWASATAITPKGVLICFLANIGPTMLAFLKQHPADEISFDTSTITNPAIPPTPPPTIPADPPPKT